MIFLTSSVALVADHLYKNFLADKGFKTILFIDTAAEPEVGHEDGDDVWLQKDLKSLQDQGYQVDRFTITGKTKEEIEKKIDEYDVLYMCGGNTAHLLNQLKMTGAFDVIINKVRSGKPYVGTSAGSIVCGPRLPDYFFDEIPGLEDTKGFGFVNFTLVPHWGDEYFKERYIGERLQKAYRNDQDPLLLLTDRQYVQVLEDGAFKIITT
jgi:dipeptidase E